MNASDETVPEIDEETDQDVLLQAIQQHCTCAGQHINLVCGAFLTYAALNATFAGLSLNVKPLDNVPYYVSHIICISFAIGNCFAGATFQGAACHLENIGDAVSSLLDRLPIRKRIPVSDMPREMFAGKGYEFLLHTVLFRMSRRTAAPPDPLNPIAVDEYCGIFGVFAYICYIAAAVWFLEFVLLLLYYTPKLPPTPST